MSRSTSLVLVASVLVTTPFLACNTLSQAQDTASNLLMPVSEENKLGVQLSKEVEKDAKLHKNKDVQEYVAHLGQKIASEAKDKPAGIKFTFKVIDDDKTVNAFALPGGHIYVYSGLMKLADDEAELASVIAHEVAHVTQRHIADRLIASYGLDALLSLALGNNPGLLGQLTKGLVEQGSLLKFTRDQESDADLKGLPYAVRAGYDPEGFVRLFSELKKGEGPAFLAFLQDHPLPSERINAVKALIAKMKNPPDKKNKDAYVEMKAKL